jgi:hypothetical protein
VIAGQHIPGPTAVNTGYQWLLGRFAVLVDPCSFQELAIQLRQSANPSLMKTVTLPSTTSSFPIVIESSKRLLACVEFSSDPPKE